MNASDASRIIAEQFPELAPVNATYLGEGCDSIAFDVAPNLVFRFPKRAEVETQLLLEARLLPRLAPRLGLAIPDHRFRGGPSASFPRHFSGYSKIPGSPAINGEPHSYGDVFAKRIGIFLSELHSFSIEEALSAGATSVDANERLHEVHAEALADLETVRNALPHVPIERWATHLGQAPEPGADEHVVIHADLAAEHVLVSDDGAPCGVIDWSEVCIGDRALYLAGLFHWGGPAFAACVLRHYSPGADVDALKRARYLALCRGIADIVFGLENGREEYVEAGVRALESNAGERE